MNQLTVQAFYDELEKIADWALSAQGPLHQFSNEQILGSMDPRNTVQGGVPQGMGMGVEGTEDVLQTIKSQRVAPVSREARMRELISSGKLNPQTHTLDFDTGEIRPRKTFAPPAPSPAKPVATGPAPSIMAAPVSAPTSAPRGPTGTLFHERAPNPSLGSHMLPENTVIREAPAAAGTVLREAPALENAAAKASRLGKFRGVGKTGLGLAALGLAGGIGYGLGS